MALSIPACMFTDHEASLFRDWYCSHVHESHKSCIRSFNRAPGHRDPNPRIPPFDRTLTLLLPALYGPAPTYDILRFLMAFCQFPRRAHCFYLSTLLWRWFTGSRVYKAARAKGLVRLAREKTKTKKQTIELREQNARKTKGKWSNGTSKLIGNK